MHNAIFTEKEKELKKRCSTLEKEECRVSFSLRSVMWNQRRRCSAAADSLQQNN